jgi:hypothetical protein
MRYATRGLQAVALMHVCLVACILSLEMSLFVAVMIHTNVREVAFLCLLWHALSDYPTATKCSDANIVSLSRGGTLPYCRYIFRRQDDPKGASVLKYGTLCQVDST